MSLWDRFYELVCSSTNIATNNPFPKNFNYLSTKIRIIYKDSVRTAQKTHSVSVIKTSHLMLYREIIILHHQITDRQRIVYNIPQGVMYSLMLLRMGRTVARPTSWSSGQSFWLLITRSRVRFPALPWEFSLWGEDPRGDHGLGS